MAGNQNSGRRPRHPDVKVARGTVNARKKQPTVVILGQPEKPSFLTDSAEPVWLAVCGYLKQMGLLASTDGAVIGSFALAVARLAEVQLELASGLYSKGRRKPAFADERTLIKEITTLARELKLTPSARGEVGSKKEDDAVGQFLTQVVG